jgi:hypothetical protein
MAGAMTISLIVRQLELAHPRPDLLLEEVADLSPFSEFRSVEIPG